MVRKLTVHHGDLWIDIDLCFSCKLTLTQWRKVVKLAGEYNPEQLEGVAEYFREEVEDYQRLIENERERLCLAEIACRIGDGKKKDVNAHKREVKALEKALADWEKRLSIVLAAMERATGRAAAMVKGAA